MTRIIATSSEEFRLLKKEEEAGNLEQRVLEIPEILRHIASYLQENDVLSLSSLTQGAQAEMKDFRLDVLRRALEKRRLALKHPRGLWGCSKQIASEDLLHSASQLAVGVVTVPVLWGVGAPLFSFWSSADSCQKSLPACTVSGLFLATLVGFLIGVPSGFLVLLSACRFRRSELAVIDLEALIKKLSDQNIGRDLVVESFDKKQQARPAL